MVTGSWSIEEDNMLIELRSKGLTAIEIAEKLNRKPASIRNRTYRLDAPLKPNVDEEFFLRDDEYSHYVLGYWLADGCIMYKSGGHYFSIVSIDKDHLGDISEIMEMDTKLYKNSFGTYEIRVGNKRLIESLISIGGDFRKTFTTSIDDLNFNKKHFRHLLRGYFDGDGGFEHSSYIKKDGSISLVSIKFTGSSKLIEGVYNYIGIKGSIGRDKRHKDCLYLQYYGDEMRELLNYMYSNCNIALQRKYKIYLEHKPLWEDD